MTTIGDYAFWDCDKLVEVYNKSSLNIVAGNTDNGYVGYYALNVYTEEGGNKISIDSNGYIIYTDDEDKILVGFAGTETDLILPSGITEIYKFAFSGRQRLASIVIPDSVTTIGDSAFASCISLTSVAFGENSQLKTIGDNAFFNCISLTNITIPDSVTTIGRQAFYECSSLTSVIFEDPNGWYSALTEGATSGDNLTLTNASTNVTYLTRYYFSHYWYKK